MPSTSRPQPDVPPTPSTALSSAGRPMANDYPAIDLPADRPYDRIREFYLYLEPSLLAAIARGDRRQAVRLLNHVLLHIYAAGEERSALLQGLMVEPVVMMSRTAIAAGSPPTEVLGLTARTLVELMAIEDDEGLAAWLRRMLDRVVDSGIIDPVTLNVEKVREMDRDAKPFRMAADVLNGVDLFAMDFLEAFRAGELGDS